jgi:hypothetical protein
VFGKGGERERNWKYNGGGELVQGTGYTHGMNTMKSTCIINV